jgi:hypothetical protein
MTTISVDPVLFESASEIMGSDLAIRIRTTGSGLSDVLTASVRMAGSDPAGIEWCDRYDLATDQLVGSIADLERAAVTVAILLQQTGFNHALSESDSDIAHVDPPEDRTRYVVPPELCTRVPSARGGTIDPPPGWEWVTRLCTAVWPDGDPGRLRRAADAWRSAATGLEDGQRLISDAITIVGTQRSPEVDAASAVCQTIADEIGTIDAQCRALATSCDELATHVEDAHRRLISEVAQLVAATAVIEVAGALLAPETVGIGEVAAQVGESAEIATTVARIEQIILELIAAARAAAGRLSLDRLARTGPELATIITRSPIAAETNPVVARAVDELRTGATPDAASSPTQQSAAVAGTALGRSEAKAIRSLSEQLAEHQRKLANYLRNPDAADNQGRLANATSDEIRQSVIAGRIRHLESEIRAFQQQIDRIRNGGS